ncbi:MAG TPA: CBS domain-containing protein [Candidatus Paceibacterota bacterium]|nr:CBS domain-containing protein [Candidatus Paceibacterota bacterium]
MPNGTLKVSDVMTKDVLAIDVDDTLDVIAGLFEKYDYDGMPVVDKDRVLKGIITAYDMILQSSDVHLPTLLRLMDQIAREKGDRKDIDQHFKKLRDIKATAIMNPNPVSVRSDATLEEAAKAFADHPKANPLSVVDENGKLVGIISRYDIIKFFNETYLQRVVQSAGGSEVFKEFPTKSEHEVEEAVKQVEEKFLIVSKRRPLIWKYLAIAMFAAGLVAATALIIRIVQRGG